MNLTWPVFFRSIDSMNIDSRVSPLSADCVPKHSAVGRDQGSKCSPRVMACSLSLYTVLSLFSERFESLALVCELSHCSRKPETLSLRGKASIQGSLRIPEYHWNASMEVFGMPEISLKCFYGSLWIPGSLSRHRTHCLNGSLATIVYFAGWTRLDDERDSLIIRVIAWTPFTNWLTGNTTVYLLAGRNLDGRTRQYDP